ncbi:hypothetical protein DSCW_27680 [Desulfosarcina widdelii]|uniref:Uncharacterized protein n=1 Tax=Desulfosarcina widdelii TaxID=947919 RepID=A0A5K7Z6P2_9BACT|nr:hypothetical protein DSCW_27680 [Desulfosarcina widdelii]
MVNIDGFSKISKFQIGVIPADAGARSDALVLSSHFNAFCMPDQARHDEPGIFYETVNIGYR